MITTDRCPSEKSSNCYFYCVMSIIMDRLSDQCVGHRKFDKSKLTKIVLDISFLLLANNKTAGEFGD